MSKKRFICGMAAAAIALSGGGALIGNAADIKSGVSDISAIPDSFVKLDSPITSCIIGSGSVYLDWKPVNGAEKYVIVDYSNGKWIKIAETSNTWCVLKNLTAGTHKLALGVMVGDEIVNIPETVKEAFTVKVTKVLFKETLAASYTIGDDGVTLNWDAVSGADKYAIWEYINDDWKLIEQTDNTTYTFEPQMLDKASEHKLAVTARFGDIWNLDFSKAITIPMTIEKANPEFTATPGDNCINLEWNAVEGAQKYAVCEYLNNEWKQIYETTDTSYTMNYLVGGKDYQVAVIAMFNDEWYEDYSKAVTVTLPAAEYVKENPEVTATVSDDRVVLDWKPIRGVKSYVVSFYENGVWWYVGKTSDTSYTLTENTTYSQLEDDVTEKLRAGKTYKFTVFSVYNGDWYTKNPTIVEVTMPEFKKEFKNENPDVTYTPGNGCATLNWDAVNGAEKYAVYGYVNGSWTKFKETDDTSYIVKGLSAGNDYEVAVIAKFNGEWYEDFSKAITVTANSAYPEIDSVLLSKKTHQAKITWDGVPNAEQYGVAVYINGKWTIQGYTKTTSFTTPKLTPGDIYRVVVCARVNGKWDTNKIAERAFKLYAL